MKVLYKTALFQKSKKYFFLHVFAPFFHISVFFALVQKSSSSLHALEYELQLYYYLHILYNLVVLT